MSALLGLKMYDFLTGPLVYSFVKGPLVWISFIIFVGGSLYRIISMLTLAKKDKVVYPYMSLKYSLRSILHWIIPFASINMRRRPWMTAITFPFHISLILTPIFLLAHNVLWYESWKITWWSLPEIVADMMALIVILCSIFFVLRRIISPEVRFVTSASDYILLAIASAPFITGFLAYHQLFFQYRPMIILHILSGEIMLIAIPFSRLSHMIFFWLTRAYMGSESGAVRHSKDW
ncbi:MAG: TmcC family electron transfer complex membrane anchor subunit [Nitrospirota bacterium]